MNFIDVYENDAGKVIILPRYAILRIVLEENPSTGYRWQVENISSRCLEIVSNEFVAKNGPAIGATGIVVFSFKPVKPGRCELYLKLWRSWEGDKSIVKQFRITVAISNG